MNIKWIPPEHPYCKQFEANCFASTDNQWGVKWRLFTSEKMDETFSSEEEAKQFQRTLEHNIKTRGVDVSYLNYWEINHYTSMWENQAGKGPIKKYHSPPTTDLARHVERQLKQVG